MGFEIFAQEKRKSTLPNPKGKGFAVFAPPPPSTKAILPPGERPTITPEQRAEAQDYLNKKRAGEIVQSYLEKETPLQKTIRAGLIGLGKGILPAKNYQDPLGEQISPLELPNVEYKPTTTLEKVAKTGGEFLGMTLPITGAYGTAGKAVESAIRKALPQLGRYGTMAARGAGAGVAFEATRAAAEGKPPAEIAKQTGVGAALFGIADPATVKAFEVAAPVVKKGVEKIGKLLRREKPKQEVTMPAIKPPKKKKEPWQMTQKEFEREYEKYGELADKGEIPEGKGKPVPPEIAATKDWKEFSRARGYTEQQIADFERWLELAGEGKGFSYDDVTPEAIYKQHIEWALRNNKNVPPEVLKEYQKIQKKPEVKPTEMPKKPQPKEEKPLSFDEFLRKIKPYGGGYMLPDGTRVYAEQLGGRAWYDRDEAKFVYEKFYLPKFEKTEVKPQAKPQTKPIEERTFEEVGKRSVKAYQYEHPELKPYIQAEANRLLGELRDTVKGERYFNEATGEFSGTKRYTSEAIERIKDETGVSYKEIENALLRIIRDEGQENQALAKRIELIIDDNLTHGTKTLEGYELPKNEEYLRTKGEITGKSYEAEEEATNELLEFLFDDVQEAREEVKKAQELLKPKQETDGTVMLYSGLPIEKVGESVEKAAQDLKDVAGIAEKNVKVITKEEVKEPGLLTPLKSPTMVAKKYPVAESYVRDGIEATNTQERLRGLFDKRLKAIDKALSGEARSPLARRRAYRENKALLYEILLTGDMLGKKFTPAELVNQFGANKEIIKAYRLTRAAYDHAWNVIKRTREMRGKEPIGYRTGYIPHFFHNYFIAVDGKLAGSAKTLREAVQMSNPLARQGRKITIVPKKFEFPGESVQASVIGDKSYFKLKGKIEKEFGLTAEEAQELLNGIARMKGRSRFVGNFLQRKGAKGWETDLDWVHRHYFNMISRYAALDIFKSRSISRFERQFGPFDKEHKGIAQYIKNYINDVNGNPTQVEELINNTMAKVPAVSKFFGRYLGDRPALQLASTTTNAVAIAKLGLYNISTALVNATTLINAYAKLGAKWITQGMRRAAMRSATDRGVLKQIGVDVQLGLESGAGYSKAGMGRLFNASTAAFQATEKFLRRATGLGAYYKVLAEGKTRQEAINYAKDVIRLTQFEYGIGDAPAFIRRAGPVGQVLFQFKKFPVKQLEFITQLQGAENARFWVPFVVLGGYFAFPGMDALKNAVEGLFNIDLELEGKKALMEWAGNDPTKQAIAKEIMYGAFSNVGADISRRVGMGDFIPGEIRDLAGPAVSTVVRTAQLAAKREWVEALRAISPAPGNLALAMQKDGEISDPWRRGRLKVVLSPQERALKAVGFMPVSESIQRDVKRIVGYSESKIREKEQRLIDEYIKARESNDKAKMEKLIPKLREMMIDPKRIYEEMHKKQLLPSIRAFELVPRKRQMEYNKLKLFSQGEQL